MRGLKDKSDGGEVRHVGGRTDGKAGTVEQVWLDELHGLRISLSGHDGKWPVSTIRFPET